MRIERAGLLVIRAWRESDSPIPLRAEVRLARDVAKGFQHRVTLSDSAEVVRLVREWLASVLDESST